MDQPRFPRRKHIRLPLTTYGDVSRVCSLTLAVRLRQPAFADQVLAQAAVAILNERVAAFGVRAYAYCIMPDHVRLILSPSEQCDLHRFVGTYKNLVQRAAWVGGYKGQLWQPRFWDHVLRSEEAVTTAVAYVLDNPVRAGLAAQRSTYPFSGSAEFPWLKDEAGET